MSSIDDYNKLVDFIGNIIKATSDPEDQEGVDNALNIGHTVGDALEIISEDNNTSIND
jgi:3-dehydroquinate synthetase